MEKMNIDGVGAQHLPCPYKNQAGVGPTPALSGFANSIDMRIDPTDNPQTMAYLSPSEVKTLPILLERVKPT